MRPSDIRNWLHNQYGAKSVEIRPDGSIIAKGLSEANAARLADDQGGEKSRPLGIIGGYGVKFQMFDERGVR